ncbi:MAG: DUF2066 domain-containing protein [Hyphomicrobium sp.]
MKYGPALLAIGACLIVTHPARAQQAGNIFTVANYPVEARAANAVAAKDKALTDGQTAAFRSLLKRIVPVTAYKQLTRLAGVNAVDMVSGVSVRTERNSSTDYIANLDFSFQADAVRSALNSHAIPFVDQQADVITVIPVTLKGDAVAEGDSRGAWRAAWSGLDLKHTLTPVKLDGLKAEIHRDTIQMMLGGDDNGFRIVSKEYQADKIVLAVAEPDLAAKKMTVTLTGIDAVGPLLLKRTYRLSDGDVAYASELAAVVALGVLEGRWKSVRSAAVGAENTWRGAGDRPVWSATGAGAGDTVRLLVEFLSPSQWNDIRTQLLDTPGVEDLQIGAASESSADVSLRFPGGAQGLANAVGARGLSLTNTGQGWTLRSFN